jgi:hypothetical protein
MNDKELVGAKIVKKKQIHKPMHAYFITPSPKSRGKAQQNKIKSLFLHHHTPDGFVVQWIEQPSPKG